MHISPASLPVFLALTGLEVVQAQLQILPGNDPQYICDTSVQSPVVDAIQYLAADLGSAAKRNLQCSHTPGGGDDEKMSSQGGLGGGARVRGNGTQAWSIPCGNIADAIAHPKFLGDCMQPWGQPPEPGSGPGWRIGGFFPIAGSDSGFYITSRGWEYVPPIHDEV